MNNKNNIYTNIFDTSNERFGNSNMKDGYWAND